jgi:acetyltransferase-like isoleucine patch superfamily enzyme
MTVRPCLHRLRGVKIGKGVWIGDDVYLENEYPEAVELEEGAVLAMRAMVVAHTRGVGRVILERFAYVCPGAMIVCAAGKTLRIGEGAFVGIGCVVTSSVAPGMVLAPPRPVPVGKARVPFGLAKTPEEFIAAIEPLRHSRNKQRFG